MKNSLVFRFVIFAVFLVLLTSVLSNGFSFIFFSGELSEKSRAGLIELVHVSKNEIEGEISLRSNFLRELAVLPAVKNYTRSKELRELKTFFQHENEVFQEIELILANGQVVFDYEKLDLESEPDTTRNDRLFKDALRDESRVYWEIIPEKTNAGVPVVAFLAGLKRPGELSAWGVLRVESFLSTFAQHMNNINNDDGSVILINKKNNVLLPLMIEPDALTGSGLNSAISEIAKAEISKTVQLVGDNEEFFFVKDDIKDSGWQVVSILTSASFYGVQDKAKRVLLLTTFILTLVGGSIAFFLGRQVVRPLQLMDSKLKNAVSGEFGKIRRSSAPGEMRTVIESYNQMVGALQTALVSQHYLDRVFSSIQEGILVVRLDGIIEKANEAACSMLGYSLEEILELTYQGLLPETDEGWLESLTRNKKAGSESLRDFKTRSGQIITTQFTWSSFNDQEGRARGMVCVLQNKPS